MWIALPAAALYAAYLRRQTRRHRAEAAKGDTRFIVSMTPKVAAEIEPPAMAEPWRRFVGFESDADLDWTKPC